MKRNYFDHKTNVRFIDSIMSKSNDWQWFVDYIEQNYEIDFSCTSYSGFRSIVNSIQDIYEKATRLFAVCSNPACDIHAVWLRRLLEIAQIWCGQKKYLEFCGENKFELLFAINVELTWVLNQANNTNYIFNLNLYEYYNYYELFDISPLEPYYERISEVFKKCDFPESSSILDLITSNLQKEKRPFSRSWIDAFTNSVFNSEEVFQYPDIARPQLLTWQEEYLFEMLLISIRDEGVVSLFAEKYSTTPNYHQWIKATTENMLEFFSGEKVVFIIETVRFITCQIEMSAETTALHLTHLVSQMKHWENGAFLFYSPLAIYKMLKEKGCLNSTDYGSCLRALKEASIPITDIGVLRKLEDCSVPLDNSCKKRIEEYSQQKCEKTASETDLNQFIKGLSDTFVQQHVTEQQFSKIHDIFCKMVDSVDQRYRPSLFYAYMQFLLSVQTNANIDNKAVRSNVIELLHNWQNHYYLQSISSMAHYEQQVRVSEEEVDHLNKAFITDPFQVAHSIMMQNPEVLIKQMQQISEHALLSLVSRMNINPVFPYRLEIASGSKSKIQNQLIYQIEKINQEHGYKFLNSLKPVQYFERLIEDISIQLNFYISVFSGQKDLYFVLLKRLPEEHLLDYSDEPKLGHITQFFPILEREIRHLGELFGIPPCKMEKNKYMQLKEPASILTEMLMEAHDLSNSFEGVSDLLFVYFAMYYANGINLRNDCIHGNGYRTKGELRFAFKTTLVCMNMIICRIDRLLNTDNDLERALN